MVIIRPAVESDLLQMHDVFYQNEVLGVQNPPPPGDISSEARHILQTGTMYVAERGEHILAFAGAITRSAITYLTDLFVHPAAQSAGLGKKLLQQVLPDDDFVHCTMSSTDPRAQSLYIRSGMQPLFPNFNLRWNGPSHEPASDNEKLSIEIIEGDAGDPALVRWDMQVSGRERPVDHAFWVKQQQAVPLWFRRRGAIIGYAYVRLGAGTLWFPEACAVGPVGAKTPEDAAECVLAATGWAQKHARVIRIDVPGPHPCLAPLLERKFRVVYVEQFVCSTLTPFFDPRRYIPSGSGLL